MPSAVKTLVPFLLLLLLAGGVAHAQDEGQLRDRIEGSQQREQQLGTALQRLTKLSAQVAREVAVLERRLAAAQREADRREAIVARTRADLAEERARALRLRRRLAQAKGALSGMLRARYMTTKPDLVTVVVGSRGYSDLLDRFAFLRRAERSGTEVLDVVRAARRDAVTTKRRLARLEDRQVEAAAAARRQRDALGTITAALHRRQALLARAKAARAAALRASRSSRRRAQRTLDKLLAERAKAASASGPGGPWAIPWPVVECESGGQNLPPNFAGASGYYQFMPATWKGMGGSTEHAHQAPKAEQDRLARQLWAGGAGADNWVCAGLVGIG